MAENTLNISEILKSSAKPSKSGGKSSKQAKKNGGAAEFFRKYIRVLKLARRPTKEEFWKISAVAAIGIVLIGAIGFIIYLLFTYVLP